MRWPWRIRRDEPTTRRKDMKAAVIVARASQLVDELRTTMADLREVLPDDDGGGLGA